VAFASTANLRARSTKKYFKDIVSQRNFNMYVAFLTKGNGKQLSEIKIALPPISNKVKKN